MNRNRGLRVSCRVAGITALLVLISSPGSGAIATASARIVSPTAILVESAPALLEVPDAGNSVRLEAGALQFSSNRSTAFSASVSILDSRVTNAERAPSHLSLDEGRLSSQRTIDLVLETPSESGVATMEIVFHAN